MFRVDSCRDWLNANLAFKICQAVCLGGLNLSGLEGSYSVLKKKNP